MVFGESLTSEALSNTLKFRLGADEFYHHKFITLKTDDYTICNMGSQFQLGTDCLGTMIFSILFLFLLFIKYKHFTSLLTICN